MMYTGLVYSVQPKAGEAALSQQRDVPGSCEGGTTDVHLMVLGDNAEAQQDSL